MASRNKVFWIGRPPQEALTREFRCRDIELDTETFSRLSLESVEAERLISQELGAVLVHDRAKLSRTISFLRQAIDAPVRHSGARVCVVAEESSEINKILSKFVGKSGQPEFQREHDVRFVILNTRGYSDFARYFSTPDPGSAPNFDLSINPASFFSRSETTLLQRSFSDCESVVIRRLVDQGFSARVYLAYPRFGLDVQRARSLPFLVKFDKTKDIERELNYYETYVNHYVPFNLRPNLDRSRCFLSGDLGILVANYVDRAVPLLEAVDKGTGPNAIHCLFEESLDQWFRNSERRDGSPIKTLLTLFDREKFEKNPEVLQTAAELGPTAKPTELVESLQAIRCEFYLYGMSHRDLHARNVLVKGSDAIVIDFSKCDSGPILVDLATLDVTIAFGSVFLNDNASAGKFDLWVEFIKEIYNYKRVMKLPEAREGFEPFARQWSCIRQIRRFALMERTDRLEFAICLAIALLRHSAFVDDNTIGVKVAAYAYYLCSELVREIQAAGSSS